MRKFLRILGKSALVLLLVSVVGLAAMADWLIWHFDHERGLPDHRELVRASTGNVCSSPADRAVVPLAAIPPVVRAAFLAAEEPDFYNRPPFNQLMALARELVSNEKRPKAKAPTISRTVVHCLIHAKPECCQKVMDWHIGNAILLHRVERDLPKDVIYGVYLNEIWLGRGAYGAMAAAQVYFGKSLPDLSAGEAAYLASLARQPSRAGRNVDEDTSRRNRVIDRMVEGGAITQAQAEAEKQTPIRVREFPPAT